jgi:membrane associated rhomboid family serine protease
VATDVGKSGVKPFVRSANGGDVAVNNAPPKWYEAWLRIEFSSLALAISLAWIAAFIAEQEWPIVPGEGLQPDIYTNTALGSLDLTTVSRGEWWRFFTNPFLHGGPNHLQWDILALLGVGPTFQAMVGRAWFGAAFALIALASGALSLLINPLYPGTIGPMGVVMGILAANFVCGFHYQETEIRTRIWQASGVSLLVSLCETFKPQGFPVDISGHIGGLITGALVGCGLLLSWPRDWQRPRFEIAAKIVAWGFAAMACAGFGMVVLGYTHYAETIAKSVPATELDAVHIGKALAKSGEYVIQYPQDPLAHQFRGQYFLSRNDFVNAEGEFRTALKLAKDWPFGPIYVDQEQEMLAFSLWYQGRMRETKEAAAPICRSTNKDKIFRRLLDELWAKHVCDD